MFNGLKNIWDKIKTLSKDLDEYKKDTIVQSLPALAHVNRAKKLIDKKCLAEAEAELLKALKLPQEDALVYKYLGIVYERQQQYEKAREYYQLSADLSPHDKMIWRHLGICLIAIRRYDLAEKAFENADKITPNNTDVFFGWGMAFYKQDKLLEAREKFNHAVHLNRFNFSALFVCAVTEVNLGMYDKAETKLSFLSSVMPNERNTYEFARLKFLKKDYQSAISYATRAVEFNKNVIQPYGLLGEAYANLYDEENSLKYFNLGVEICGFNEEMFFEWGKALVKFEKYQEAKGKFSKVYESDYPNSACYLALSCVMTDDFEGYAKFIEKCDDENPVTKQAKGVYAYKHNDFEDAIKLLRTENEDAFNYYYMAKSYVNDDVKARESYNEALRIYPEYLSCYLDFVEYLMSKQDYKEAQRKLRKALKSHEDNIDLLNLMFYCSYILAKEKVCEYNVKEALIVADKIEKISPDLFKYYEQKAELEKFLSERD